MPGGRLEGWATRTRPKSLPPPQCRGGLRIHAAPVRRDGHAVVPRRRLDTDHAVAHVAQHQFRRARERVAPAAAARRSCDHPGRTQAAHAVLRRDETFAVLRLDPLLADGAETAALHAIA